ncbi:MAG TPA: ATP-binding protein [Kofleriaceae bacterium]
MKLVAKYTLALVGTLVVVLAIGAYFRLGFTREQIEAELRRSHAQVAAVLEDSIDDFWVDAAPDAALRVTNELIAKANADVGAPLFRWEPDGGTHERQTIEGGELVSHFPVEANGTIYGAIVARESLDQINSHMRTQLLFTIGGIVLIVALGAIASVVLGAWLVRTPIALLVAQARRIGRGELANDVAFSARDELGELAIEMSAASKALAESQAKSARETAARLAAVEQMRHADRLSTVGKLAAGVAHELGTPLSIVGGHAQMIAEGEVKGDAAIASARAIDAEATRMGKIVRQLLDFARRKGPEGVTCEPNDVVERSVQLLGVMADRAKVKTIVDVATPSPRIGIDEDSLQQILTNLAVNAIQAMPTGGTLTVSVKRVAGRVRIAVRDTGPGIPADVREHIFEPFFTTKAVGDGTGLGLAVVHGIVTDHGGEIFVDTGAGGTTFSMDLQEASA